MTWQWILVVAYMSTFLIIPIGTIVAVWIGDRRGNATHR